MTIRQETREQKNRCRQVDDTVKLETYATDKMKNDIGQKRRQDEEQEIGLEANDKNVAKSERHDEQGGNSIKRHQTKEERVDETLDQIRKKIHKDRSSEWE